MAKRGGKKKGIGKRKGHKRAAKRGGKKKSKTQLHIPNITSMAKKVGKALGAGLKRPAGAALKRAKGKGPSTKAIKALGYKLAPKKRGGKKKKGK